MADISRRRVLAGAAAVAAAAAVPPPARAAAPAMATGLYRYKVGDIDVVQLMDGASTFPMPDDFVVNVSKDEALKAAAAAYMPDGQVTIPFSPMIVRTGSKLVAIDTGNGLGAYAASKGAVGQARRNMEAAGIDPKQVDIVLISHFHADHIGGLKNADGTPAFPNAVIKVPDVELMFWSNPANAAGANAFNKAQFSDVAQMLEGLRVTTFHAGADVAPGITAIAAPGHTPGHTAFGIASGNKSVLVQGDLTNIPALFLRHPDWHCLYDNQPEVAQTTRHRIYDMAATDKIVIVGYHFPYPCAGHVEKAGNDYRLVPVAWDPNG